MTRSKHCKTRAEVGHEVSERDVSKEKEEEENDVDDEDEDEEGEEEVR